MIGKTQKNNRQKRLEKVLTLTMLASLSCSAIVSFSIASVSAASKSEWITAETEIQSAESEVVDITTLPESLTSLLTWFTNYHMDIDKGSIDVFDSKHQKEDNANVIARIVAQYPCVPLTLYPDVNLEGHNSIDPRGWGSLECYNTYNGPAIDWIARNILNVSEEDIARSVEQCEQEHLLYKEATSDGSYEYVLPDATGVGGVFPSAKVVSARKTGDLYQISYEMVLDFGPYGYRNDGPAYMELALKNIDGKEYWSIYRFMRGVSAWPGYLDFRDLDTNAWYFPGVQYVIDHGIMSGYNAIRFAPEQTTTRAMIVTMLHRLENEPEAGENPFSDVTEGDYFAKAAAWASKNGIMTGYENGNFGPSDPISREQMAAVLYRYAKYKGLDVSLQDPLTGFSDAENISTYAQPAMQWAVAAGLIKGMNDTKLAPQAGANRGQVAAILERFAGLQA